MNADHPNAAAYRKAADAFRARGLRAIEALVDEDVVWHVPGHHPRAGEIRGRDALLAWLTDLAEVGFVLRDPRLDVDARGVPSGSGGRAMTPLLAPASRLGPAGHVPSRRALSALQIPTKSNTVSSRQS